MTLQIFCTLITFENYSSYIIDMGLLNLIRPKHDSRSFTWSRKIQFQNVELISLVLNVSCQKKYVLIKIKRVLHSVEAIEYAKNLLNCCLKKSRHRSTHWKLITFQSMKKSRRSSTLSVRHKYDRSPISC